MCVVLIVTLEVVEAVCAHVISFLNDLLKLESRPNIHETTKTIIPLSIHSYIHIEELPTQ